MEVSLNEIAYKMRHKIQAIDFQMKQRYMEEYSKRGCNSYKYPKTRKKDHKITEYKIVNLPEVKFMKGGKVDA